MPPVRTIAKRILIALLIVVAIVYVCDFASVRVRMMHAKPADPFETITALRILAIDEKGGKTEYDVDPVQPQQTGVCVHALFPHNGDLPCWYLKKKFAQPIPMTIFPFGKPGR
ncbi:MAG TPA: hypothetical protein VJW94_02950 [Candidatus Acidoferrum sp.]|nr:hypothetical protein [Candidatus Acidoferrum sp.]